MTNEEIKVSLTVLFPAAVIDETGEFLAVIVNASDLRALMVALREREEFDFDYLFCLTGIDWKTHLMTVYHLLSKKHRHTVVVKAKMGDVNNPQVDTVCDIWQTANFHEREIFDLLGVKFLNHPDLRRILLTDDWDGYPLRKNYVDENMIAL